MFIREASGDFVNNNDSWIPILNFIESQFQSYFFQEQQPDRLAINDMRISVCLYFLRPTGHRIEVFKCPVDHSDPIDNQIASEINESMPFAIVGSDRVVQNKSGEEVLGREYPWGVVEVENDEHCDFRKLRNLLIRTNMLDLIMSTDEKGIGELRKKRENPKFKEEEEALRFKFTEQVRIEESRFRQWELKLIAERDRLNKDLEAEHMTLNH
ncbi:Septin spn4 [Massospora cicadina]|nr:Septin spn4 [Massospora cicadina]